MTREQEFVFGYRYKDFNKIASLVPEQILKDLKSNGNEDKLTMEELEYLYLNALSDIAIHFRPFSQKIIEQFPNLLTKAGFKVDPQDAQNFISGEDVSLTTTTPLGNRNLACIEFASFFEPYEFNEFIENSVIGFRLSKKYTPVFLDWQNTQGGLHNFVLDDEFNTFVKLAKEFIVSIVPAFSDAELIIRDVRY